MIRDESLKFAIKIVELYNYLTDEKREFVMSKQLLRSGTSIGANSFEAKYAISSKDFLNKLYISLKECNESLYWLILLHETSYISDEQYNDLYRICESLRKMLSSATKTVKEKEGEENE